MWRKIHGNLNQCTLSSFFSNRNSVDLVFDVKDFSSDGPYVWQLNLGLCQDTHFCEMTTKTISERVEYQRCVSSLHDWWDFLNSFRDIAQDFSKRKQRNLNREKMTATNLMTKANHDLIAGDFLAINLLQNEAVKIRSRAQWLEGESLMKYFLRLSQHMQKRILFELFTMLMGSKSPHNRKLKPLIMISTRNCTLVKE